MPVVTTAVGGNQEVVCEASLGTVVPFGDSEALAKAIKDSFIRSWDRAYIRSYAEKNSWDERVTRLCQHFLLIAQGPEGQHERSIHKTGCWLYLSNS